MLNIILDIVTLIICIVSTSNFKKLMNTEDIINDSNLYNEYNKTFKYSLGLICILLLRLIYMISTELFRIKNCSYFKTIKYNTQIMILIGRFIYNLLFLVPYFFIGSTLKILKGLSLWLPITILAIEEIPGLFLSVYLFLSKNSNKD